MFKKLSYNIVDPIMDKSISYGICQPIEEGSALKTYTFYHIERVFSKAFISDAQLILTDDTKGEQLLLPVKALWDTGSPTSCITKKITNQYNLSIIAHDKPIYTGSGNDYTNVTEAGIILDNIPTPFKLPVKIVANNPYYDIIIGMDIISNGILTVDSIHGDPTLKFEYLVFDNSDELIEYHLKYNTLKQDTK